MEPSPQSWQTLVARSRRVPALALGAALAVLALTIAVTTRQVRAAIRDQIVHRDGALLHAVALGQLEEATLETPEEPPDLLVVLLATSRLKGVMAARLLDADGRFVEGFPASVREANLPPADLVRLRSRQPVCRFHPGLDPGLVFYPDPERPAAGVAARLVALEVNVPLHSYQPGPLLGVAQFVIEGQGVETEFRQLDRHLAYQAAGAFGVAGSLLAASMGWAFRRLRRAQRELEQRSAQLLRANQDLALTARMSAVGAVTTHLIHGLKSPLAGLQQFVSSAGGDPGDWEQAAAVARRMQSMIHDVVNLVREDEGGVRYEFTLEELTGLVQSRLRAAAAARQVELRVTQEGRSTLDNHTANLVALILVNLLENAVEASPSGRSVDLEVRAEPGWVRFGVRDRGPGLSEAVRAGLFTPVRSDKEGGTGIGLAICRQLAAHLGASLELRESSANGCVFDLSVPVGAGRPAV